MNNEETLSIGETTLISILLLPLVPIVFVLSFAVYFIIGLVILAVSLGALWLLLLPFVM